MPEAVEQQPETSTAIALHEQRPLEVRHAKPLAPLAPRNMAEALKFSEFIANSDLAPKDFKGKPGNVLIAIQMGAEVGLSPMAAIQNIAVINGRPSLWGDSALAVVMQHKAYEGHKEEIQGDGQKMVAVFRIKRHGHDWYETRFSVEDAVKAKLWGKEGPWQTYPKRMLQMRARSFGMRDKFPDALRGLSVAEEAMDVPPDNTPVIEASSQQHPSDDAVQCERCSKTVTPTTATKNGSTRTVTVRDQVNRSKEMWGKNICADCQRAISRGAPVEVAKEVSQQQQQPSAPAFETKIEHVPDSGGLVEVVGIPTKFEPIEAGNRKKLVITMSDGYGLQTWHTGSITKNRLNLAISKAEPTLFVCQETEKAGTKYLDMNDIVRVGDVPIEQLELNSTMVP